jgi:hypothetical protein
MEIPFPPLDVTTAFLPFVAVALSMIGITVFVLARLLPRERSPLALSTMVLGVAALGGGSLLLLALMWVFVDPNGTTAWTWVLLAFNFMMMVPAGLWFVSLIVYRDRRVDWHGWLWPAVLAVVVVGSETMMGILFAVGGGNAPQTPVAVLALGLGSIWFYWSMGTVMLALILWLPIRGLVRGSLGALTAAAFLAPWVVAAPLVGIAGMGLLMTAVVVALYVHLGRRARIGSADLGVVVGLAVAFALMVGGQVAVVAMPGSYGAALAFGGTTALAMLGELAYVFRQSADSYYTDIKRIQVGTPSGAL